MGYFVSVVLIGVQRYLVVPLMCISLISRDIGHVPRAQSPPCIFFVEASKYLDIFKNRAVVFSSLNRGGYSYILETSSLLDTGFENTFPQARSGLFVLFSVRLGAKAFNVEEARLSVFAVMGCAFVVSEGAFPNPESQRAFPVLPPQSSVVLAFYI